MKCGWGYIVGNANKPLESVLCLSYRLFLLMKGFWVKSKAFVLLKDDLLLAGFL